MYLKRLSIQGFKSFANRTAFDYGRGVTAIVGPNGSGKSNVADAIRWVLGEQSSRLLRAKKQEDVIFAGGGARAPVGMAEVLLTLDNEERWLPVDFAEVEIGRRIYRNGDSEYLLNGAKVRLRDVIDLLMKGDVGQNSYSIMGQGLVDEVLSMTPEERRSFLDEAADVKRFRMKVKEAQDRLAANRENTARLGLIVAEIAPRLTQLSRQAERAAEHRRLAAELAELLRLSYGHRWNEAQNALVRARATLDQRVAEDAAAAERVERLRAQLNTLDDEIRRRRESIERRDAQNARREQRIADATRALTLAAERLTIAGERRDQLAGEAETLKAELESLSEGGPPENAAGDGAEAEAASARAEADQQRRELQAAEEAFAAARSRRQEARDALDSAGRRLAALQAELRASDHRAADLEAQLKRALTHRRQLLDELIEYGRRFAEARAAVVSGEAAAARARSAADTSRDRLRRVIDDTHAFEAANNDELRELDYLEGRLEALQRVEAEAHDVASGTRSVLAMGRRLAGAGGAEFPEVAGVIGLLAQQLKVPARLEAAINAALEQRLHAVIVEDEQVALDAIGLLRAQRLGRAQFLPVRAMRQGRALNLQREKGVVGVASRLITCERRYQAVVDTLLGRVIVVEDIETGFQMLRRGLGSVVTLDGVYIDPSGALTGGGSAAEDGLFARRRELEELPQRIALLRQRAETAARHMESARAAVQQLEHRVDDEERAFDEVRRELESARGRLERERDRLHRLRREMDQARAREGGVRGQMEAGSRQAAEATAAIGELSARHDEYRATLERCEMEVAEATARRDAAMGAVSEATARLAAAEGEQRTRLALREQHQRALQRLQAQLDGRREQLAQLDAGVRALEEQIGQFTAERERAQQELAGGDDAAPDRDELRRLEQHERQVQQELADAQAELLHIDRRRLDLEAEVERARVQIDALRNEMEREGLGADAAGRIVALDEATAAGSPSDQEAPIVQGGADIDVAATHARIEELRRQIRRLGPINDEAPEDYRELQERHDYLVAQLADLEAAEEQLSGAIRELNEEIRVRFSSTFEQVNRSFGEYFEAFFGGGAAGLSLTDPDNIAEAGIEIEAQPPGKRLRSLALLSGGERSLTAVALLFALLTANPAPFCVLDEVDAALDEANVGRFTAALKQLAEKTQFLVVTHNRRTVEMADAIYGVSMMRDGVSKVLSLRLADLPKD